MSQISLNEFIEGSNLEDLLATIASALIYNVPKPLARKYRAYQYFLNKLSAVKTQRERRLVILFELAKIWLGYSNVLDFNTAYIPQLKSILILLNEDPLTDAEESLMRQLELRYYIQEENIEKTFEGMLYSSLFNLLKEVYNG